MKLLYLVSCFIVVQAGRRNGPCDGPVINNVHYTKEVLKNYIDRPHRLSIDKANNVLYFSYSSNKGDATFSSARLNLNTNEFADIDEVFNGFASAVDKNTHDVYLGGKEGIYKYNKNSNKAEFFAANGVNVWLLFFKDVLYFAEYPVQLIYTVQDGKVVQLDDLEKRVDNFFIDDDNNMFFTNYSGLYTQKKGSKDAVKYEKVWQFTARAFTTDSKGNVYACAGSSLYRLNRDARTLEKYVTIDPEDMYDAVFDDKDNLIYADTWSIKRLKKSEKQDCD